MTHFILICTAIYMPAPIFGCTVIGKYFVGPNSTVSGRNAIIL